MTTDSEESSSIIELPEGVDVVLSRPAKSARRQLFEAVVCRIMRLILAAVFLYAGALKAKDPIRFAEDIRNFQLVADPVPAALALSLPWLEIFAALGVLTGLFYRGSLVILIAMLAGFIAAITTAWARGLEIACGCFGGASSATTNYPLHLAENTILAAMGIILLLYTWRRDRKA